MDRVLVIGCSAAGRSTVAQKIGEILGIAVTHLDKLMWKPGCKLTRPEEEHGKIRDLLDEPRWVMDDRPVQFRVDAGSIKGMEIAEKMVGHEAFDAMTILNPQQLLSETHAEARDYASRATSP